MGGSTTGSQNFNTATKQNPYGPAVGPINDLVKSVGNIPTTPMPAQTAGANMLEQNAYGMPNFGGAAGNVVGDLLSGQGNAGLDRAYSNLHGTLAPYTNSNFIDPYSNPAFAKYLETTTNDIANRTNSQFAGAGRDLSGINQQSLARGITEGTAPIFANEYNTLAGLQQGAAGNLFNAGVATNQYGTKNQIAGINAAGVLPNLYNTNANALLQAGQTQQGLPYSGIAQSEGLLLPIAQAFMSKNTNQQGTQTTTAPWYEQVAGINGALFGKGGTNGGAVGTGLSLL